MVTVIGLWEPVWMESDRTERRLWKQTVQAYDVDRWIMVPSSGTTFSSPIQYETFEEALEKTEGKKTFLICPRTYPGIDIREYEHPKNAIYVIGSTVDCLTRYAREEDDIVSAYTPQRAEMFGCCFLPLVLHDRMMKS